MFGIEPWLIAVFIIAAAAFIAAAVYWGIRAHQQKILAGREDLVGKTAEARTSLKPKGIIFVEGERWTAIAEQDRVEPGEEVIVTKVDGLKLWVIKK